MHVSIKIIYIYTVWFVDTPKPKSFNRDLYENMPNLHDPLHEHI